MPKTTLVPVVPDAPEASVAPLALYAQIKDVLRARILDGTYPPHSQMPSEHDLCRMFDVSRITAICRRASCRRRRHRAPHCAHRSGGSSG
jgi:DNA-binding transcriptional MocR family regulator